MHMQLQARDAEHVQLQVQLLKYAASQRLEENALCRHVHVMHEQAVQDHLQTCERAVSNQTFRHETCIAANRCYSSYDLAAYRCYICKGYEIEKG